MKLVPNDPTEEMIAAADKYSTAKHVYKVMIAAAPPAPKGLEQMLEELCRKGSIIIQVTYPKDGNEWEIYNYSDKLIGRGPTSTAALEAALREVEK